MRLIRLGIEFLDRRRYRNAYNYYNYLIYIHVQFTTLFYLTLRRFTKDFQRLLAHDLGKSMQDHRHDNQDSGEGEAEVRPVLATGGGNIGRVRQDICGQFGDRDQERLHHHSADGSQ